MKVKLLATLLGISVLLNVAGLVFFINFLRLQGHYRVVRRERNLMAQNLSAARAASMASDALDTGQIKKRTFVSLADGKEDIYGLMPPAVVESSGDTLIVYLHGMGSSYLEPFLCPSSEPIAQAIKNKYANIGLLSCSYRKDASWGNDLAMSDITQNIREILQEYPFRRIVMMGTSMGACTVLSYTVSAPPDIKTKIKGIVSAEGAGDMRQLYETSQNDAVKFAIVNAFGGTCQQVPEIYRRKSFIANINALPSDVRVAVISAKLDKIVPPKLQQGIVDVLEQNHKIVKMIAIDAGHGAPSAAIYIQGLEFALGNSQ